MHKLMHKGLKKKKKSKKGKKEAEEEEFNPEELERYRRERAEALVKASTEVSDRESDGTVKPTGSDEWKKFQALTAGVDSILKKTQGDLDRIKSTSFFQRKPPVIDGKTPEKDPEELRNKSKRWIGFDKDGNPVEQQSDDKEIEVDKKSLSISETGFVEIPEDENDEDDSAEEDIFDTTYIDVLQKIDIQLAYIPDSPTEEQYGDDPFDTTNADKVLKTVDKHGKKVVSLGNAVEVLSGRIDHVSSCKISRPLTKKNSNLLLDDTDEIVCEVTAKVFEFEKTILDHDDNSNFSDAPVDLTIIPSIINSDVSINGHVKNDLSNIETSLDISEFETLKEKRILEEIPDFDDEFELDGPIDESVQLEDVVDPFAEKESIDTNVEIDIIEASFEVATFVNEEDPFDTTFVENLVPGKAELKFIEKELGELPESTVSISLTDPLGLHRDYETGLLTVEHNQVVTKNFDLLGGSATDLTQLTEQPIIPVEEITYVDPFDTSGIQEPIPGQIELKFLEEELLADNCKKIYCIQDDDFNPRKEESLIKSPPPDPKHFSPILHHYQYDKSIIDQSVDKLNFESKTLVSEEDTNDIVSIEKKRKPSRPEELGVGSVKIVAFELPTPSQRPDLLITSDEEKLIVSKPLTPYYSQKSLEKSLEKSLSVEDHDNSYIDPFDTSFVSKVTPGKTELKLIESELLEQQPKHSVNNFKEIPVKLKNFKFCNLDKSVIEENKNINDTKFEIKEKVNPVEFKSIRQESLLDAEVLLNTKPLTPCIESRIFKEEIAEGISYVDPFDTSLASNILPGKAELKQLESELNQIPVLNIHAIVPSNSIDVAVVTKDALNIDNGNINDSHECKIIESQDFLSLGDNNSDDKVLTPLHDDAYGFNDNVDPFDTSFAVIEPGKMVLKLLESELINK